MEFKYCGDNLKTMYDQIGDRYDVLCDADYNVDWIPPLLPDSLPPVEFVTCAMRLNFMLAPKGTATLYILHFGNRLIHVDSTDYNQFVIVVIELLLSDIRQSVK